MTDPTSKGTQPANGEPPLAPRPSERRAIDAARASVKARTPRVTVDFTQDGSGNIDLVGGGHSDHNGWVLRLQDAFGTRATAFSISQLNHLLSAARDDKGKIDRVRVNSMLAMIDGLRPSNEMQAALAVQAAVTHNAALSITQRAMRVDQIPQFDSAANTAVKLLRTFVLQIEALAKLQRGAEQIVKVVHVHPGGQAVVGNVITRKTDADRAGEGATCETANQPHEPDATRPDAPAEGTPLLGHEQTIPIPLQGAGRERLACMPVPRSPRGGANGPA